MNRVTKLVLALLLASAGVLGGRSALAQGVTTAAMNGQVIDETGEGLPGATVIAVHLPSGTRFGTTTRSDGRYNLQGVRVGGPYAVSFTFIGYRAEERVGIELALGQDLALNVQLREEGVEGQEVIVEGTRDALINPDRTGAQTTINQEQIENLPTLSRSISDLTRITPQATGFNSFGGRNNLYNNLSVDGSVFNNVFGLASEVGGQTNSPPISIDAIEQIQVSIAPYDVRQGSFTGAGINVITRSGTNQFTGTAYTYLKNEALVSDRIEGDKLQPAEFKQNQYGFSVGGPILKNRAFFFVNGEIRRRTDPGATFRPRTSPGETGADVASVNQSTLDSLSTLLQSKFGYDPGSYNTYDLGTDSDNLTARFDANLSQSNRFSLRFNYLNSSRNVPVSNSGSTGNRQNDATHVPFSNSNYTINNDVFSVIGQLNSTFGNKYANVATIGYTALRDARSSASSPFPLVDIENGNNTTFTSFGYEPFTANNKLDTDIFQFSNNFTAFLGRHTVTLGTSNEFYTFANGFTPQFYGAYRFRSVSDFFAHVNAADPRAAGVPQPTLYQVTYSAIPGQAAPLAEIDAAQLGFYVQDEIRAAQGIKFTIGLRADVPVFTNELRANPTVAALDFAGGEKIDVSKFPDATPLFSPRLGFNWDVFNDQKLQVRGGTGIFTGKIPFVWVSNQASNNGVLFGSTRVTGNGTQVLCQPGKGGANGRTCVAADRIVFSPDRDDNIPDNPTTPASVLINATANDFKFPQVFRNNLAFDARLPYGFTATLEGIYTKDVNAVFHRDTNLKDPIGTFTGPDQRPRFAGTDVANRLNAAVTNAIVLDNTNQGYQYSLTGQLQKRFTNGLLDGLYGSLAYTTGKARDLTSSSSAIAATAYNNNQVYTNPNDPVLGFSNNDQRQRMSVAAGYSLEYLGLANTSLSLIYIGGSGFNYSYTYAGDMNGDRIFNNDLVYIPRDARDATEIAITGGTTARPEATIREQLEAFIAQDPYLSDHRGEYAQRGEARTPWLNRVDIGVRQQLFSNIGRRRATVEFSFDLINAGNFVNSDWGVSKSPVTTRPISSTGVTTAGQPTFTFPLVGGEVLTKTLRADTDLSSRWQGQFGLRVRF